MRLVEIFILLFFVLIGLVISFYFEKKILFKIKMVRTNRRIISVVLAVIVVFIAKTLSSTVGANLMDPWVESPALAVILNENNQILSDYSITKIEVNINDYSLESRGGKLVTYNGGNTNVYTGYKVKTNINNLFITNGYLLRGFKAKYRNGKWEVKVPESVTTRDVTVAKEQVVSLVKSIIKDFQNNKDANESWD